MRGAGVDMQDNTRRIGLTLRRVVRLDKESMVVDNAGFVLEDPRWAVVCRLIVCEKLVRTEG